MEVVIEQICGWAFDPIFRYVGLPSFVIVYIKIFTRWLVYIGGAVHDTNALTYMEGILFHWLIIFFSVPRELVEQIKRPKCRVVDSDSTSSLSAHLTFDDEGRITNDPDDLVEHMAAFLKACWRMLLLHSRGLSLTLTILADLVPTPTGKLPSKKASPPYDFIARARGDFSEWVEPERLPHPKFWVDELKRLTPQEVMEWAEHIVKGERGELDAANVFKWKGQLDGDIHMPVVPRRV
jgi:hypothetical protein